MLGSEGEEVEEQYLLNLQEFVEVVQPQMKELEALTQVEEFVSSLESTDPNFHRYGFISQMKDSLDTELTPLIDQMLLDGKEADNEDHLKANRSSELMKTEEFQNISSHILKSVQAAASKITDHLNSDTFDFSGPFHKFKSSNDYFNASQSDCSTADGMEFMFMSPDRYKTLAQDISPSRPIEQRLKALSILQHLPQGDLVASEAWQLTKEGIHKALNDYDEEINQKALKLLSKIFVSGNSHVIREYFLLLVENLSDYFNDSTSHMVSLNGGLDLGDRRNVLLLKKFRLLNEIQKELPKTWLRYSERYIEEMIEAMVHLLGISPSRMGGGNECTLLNPYHFLCMVDPHGVWFKKWIHGFYSRSHLLNSIHNHMSFLKRSIKSCIEVCRKLHHNNEQVTPNDESSDSMIFDQFYILYIQFIHSVNILVRLMQFKKGRSLLHFELNNGKFLDIGMLFVALVDVVKLHPSKHLKSQYHGGQLILDGFKTLCNIDNETIKDCFCWGSIYQSIIHGFEQNVQSIPQLLEILSELAGNALGCEQLLIPRTSSKYEKKLSLIEFLAEIYIQNGGRDLETSLVPTFMKLLRQLFKNSDCVVLLSKYNLKQFFYQLYIKQQGESAELLEKYNKLVSNRAPTSSTGSGSARRSAESQAYKKSLQTEQQIFETILCLNLTSKGVILFFHSDIIDACVSYFGKCLQENNRTANNRYGYIMAKVASNTKGCQALVKAGYDEHILSDIWFHLEGCTNDYTLTVLDNEPEDLSDRLSKELFYKLCEILPNFQSAQVMLEDSKKLQKQDEPVCLDEFIKYTVLYRFPSGTRLFRPEQTHFFGLSFMNYVVASLDVMLFLQSKYDFKDVFFKMQQDCYSSEHNAYILDQNCIKRNEILVQTSILGGPDERKMPSPSLSSENTYNYPLFSSQPVPAVYFQKQKHSSPSKQHNNKAAFTQLSNVLKGGGEEELKKCFLEALRSPSFKDKNELLASLLESQMQTSSRREIESQKSYNERSPKKKSLLRTEESVAIDMLVRYGLSLRRLSSQDECTERLKKLLSIMKNHWSTKGHVMEYKGFDWLMGILFLIFKGDEGRTFGVLKSLSTHEDASFIWPSLAMVKEQALHVDAKLFHWIEYILERELPHVSAAFRISGLPPSQICQLWRQQCFLNFLNFQDIQLFIVMCLTMGHDFHVYFMLSLFRHSKRDILQQSQEENLLLTLRTMPFNGYQLHEHVDFFLEIQEKYSSDILNDFL